MAKDPTTITMTKGDTATFHFHREDAAGQVIATKADKVYFTVKRFNSTKDTDVVLQKKIDDFTFDDSYEYHFTIEPDDTKDLDHRHHYIYDLEVITTDDQDHDIISTIAKGQFELTYEVTAAADEV